MLAAVAVTVVVFGVDGDGDDDGDSDDGSCLIYGFNAVFSLLILPPHSSP